MVSFHIQCEDPVPAIQSLEDYFREGGISIIQAAFKHTYFVHPDAVLKPESTEGGRRVSVLKRQEGAPVNLG